MIDIKLIRTNPELVKENIKKKFQDEKLVLVDEVAQFDEEYRAAKTKADELRNKRKVMSKQIGGLMAKGQKDEAEKVKALQGHLKNWRLREVNGIISNGYR